MTIEFALEFFTQIILENVGNSKMHIPHCFSNLIIRKNHQESFLKHRFLRPSRKDSKSWVHLGGGSRICLSNKLPGVADGQLEQLEVGIPSWICLGP